jgi:hypothetical protein
MHCGGAEPSMCQSMRTRRGWSLSIRGPKWLTRAISGSDNVVLLSFGLGSMGQHRSRAENKCADQYLTRAVACHELAQVVGSRMDGLGIIS